MNRVRYVFNDADRERKFEALLNEQRNEGFYLVSWQLTSSGGIIAVFDARRS